MTHRPTPSDIDADDIRFVAALRTALAGGAAADTIGATAPPDHLLELIVRTAARAIPCPEGALMLVDREREVLTFDVVIGSTAAKVRDLTVPLGHGIAGLVAVSGQALAIANAREDPRHARDVAEKSGYLPTTILAVPVLAADGMPTGVLELLDRQGQPTFDLDDMDLLGAFAAQVAIVLELRRTQQVFGTRVGSALATLSGLPSGMSDDIAERAEALAARVAADETSRRIAEMADLVVAIASAGPAEHEACVAVLQAFAGYLDSRPTYGMEMYR